MAWDNNAERKEHTRESAEVQQIPFASCHCVSNMVHSKNKIV